MKRRLLARLAVDIVGSFVFFSAAVVCAVAAMDPMGGAMVGDRAIALGLSGFFLLTTWATFADGSAVTAALGRNVSGLRAPRPGDVPSKRDLTPEGRMRGG